MLRIRGEREGGKRGEEVDRSECVWVDRHGLWRRRERDECYMHGICARALTHVDTHRHTRMCVYV